jgi:Ca-activated chloride channel family protein
VYIIALLSSSLSSISARPPAADDDRIKFKTEIVSLNVSVVDREGRSLSALTKADFQIFDDGVRQEISYFGRSDAPASIGIVFDVSGSMTQSRMAQAREALARFVETTHPDDEFFLISCGARPAVLLDHAREGESLLRRVAQTTPRGNTALFDSVALALEKVGQGRHPKRAIVVISDGEDNHSRLTSDKLRRRLQEVAIPVWTVLVGSPRVGSNGGAIMDNLAAVSGGRAYFPRNPDKMSEAFEQIALELRNLYSIGYTPSSLVADGRWHKVKVQLTPSIAARRAVVRTREGYYAPRPEPPGE